MGVRIERARKAAGLSMREAAARAGLSAMAISKFERGLTTPTSGTLIRLARALGTRTEFFFRPETVELEKPEYRKRSRLGKKQLEQIEADILDQAERFVELVGLFPQPPLPRFEVPARVPTWVASLDDVEQVALSVRETWKLGIDAIPALSDTLEERGLLVLTTDVDNGGKFDGLAARVGALPLVVVGAAWPGDRQRFTLAHELGHLMLAGRLADGVDEEAACNRFAGAFLVPAEQVRRELGDRRTWLADRELYQLKHAYGLSIAGWVYRAADTGVITPNAKKRLFMHLSAQGWRKQEPGDPVPSEAPKLFDRLVWHAHAEDLISTSKAAELLRVSTSVLAGRQRFEDAGAAAHQ